MLRFSGAGVSDSGRVRDHNEDSAFIAPYVAMVADGVGGAAAGEVASATATYVVSAYALARFGTDPVDLVLQAVSETTRDLVRGVDTDPVRAGMATTLTVMVTDGDRVVLGHVGDSRAYRWSAGRLTQVSHDHTYVQRLVDDGALPAEAVPRHPWRNVVLRSLHADVSMGVDEVEIVELAPVAGDRYLLCSDGLTDLVADDEIADALHIADPHSCAARLVALALTAGGTDNVTCLVFDVIDGPRVCGDGMLLGAVRDIDNVVDAGSVRSG